MKKILFALIVQTAICNGQITLEHTYPTTPFEQNISVVRFFQHGYKYYHLDKTSNTAKLYNLNHSVFKTIYISVPGGWWLADCKVSDSLFNSDNAIEALYVIHSVVWTGTKHIYKSETNVISETGTNILSIPQGVSAEIWSTGSNGYKLIVNIDSLYTLSLEEIRVYSLIGALPTGVKSHPNIEDLSSPFPNPSSGKVTIAYQIPEGQSTSEIVIYDIQGKELKRYQVDKAFSTLEIDNSDLPSGTYLYQLAGSNQAKKMIIIK